MIPCSSRCAPTSKNSSSSSAIVVVGVVVGQATEVGTAGDDGETEYTIAITPVLPTVELENSLSMGEEHLSTIPEKEEFSVEDLILIL
ncbi:hypothetical protein Tco_1293043, partial [Tanacetum coccineum]